MIAFLKKLLTGEDKSTAAHRLYVEAVEQARNPAFYRDFGVEDSLDGRFDLIILHLWLIVARLHHIRAAENNRAEAAAKLEQRLMAVHFADMDQALRESGVGDLSVGKKVKAMAQAFYGRARAYDAAVAELDETESAAYLAEALERNVYRGRPAGDGMVGQLAEYVVMARRLLAEQPVERLLDGDSRFPPLDRAPRQDEEAHAS